jgi:site-specific DNA recombinase
MTAARTLTSTDAPKRAVIYTRISFAKDGDTKGVERQEQSCRALAGSRGWEVVDVITENDTSATKGRRPLYEQMIIDARAGRYDVIVGWAVDRITRSPREVEDLITLSESTGVMVATVSGDLDLTTDQGRLVGRILGSVARGEVERKTARMKAQYAQAARAGEQPRIRCYGYRTDGTVDPVEADVVRDAYARFVAGQGAWGITRWLNEQGYVNTKGEPWSYRAVGWMIRNPRYAAERWHMFDNNAGLKGMEYVGPGNWEPIVDAQTWAAAKAKVADNATKYPATSPNRKHLGSGLLICGVCGKGLRGYWQTQNKRDGGSRKYLRYGCYPSRHLIRRAPEVNELLIAEVVRYLRENDLGALMRDEQAATLSRELREEAVGLQGSLHALEAAMALPVGHRDYLSPATAGRAEQRILARLKEIETERAKAGKRSALALVAGAADPGKAWQELAERDIRAAQEVVRAVCTITVLPAARGRGPFDPSTVRFDWTRAIS